MEENIPTLESIYSRIYERRVALGHPTTFSEKKPRKTQNSSHKDLIISDYGGVMFK